MRHRSNFLLVTLLLLTFFNSAQAANIVASADRNQIFLDESFTLTFDADASVDRDPDFTPLENDFQIINQVQSSNISLINGNYSRSILWKLRLMARKSGTLTVPSISFGSDHSPALRIQIKDPSISKKPHSLTDETFVEVEIEQDKAWVQSQIIYKVRLFNRISITNLRGNEPTTNDPDAIFEQLSNTSYEAMRDGKRFTVHEIRYAVFPQHSGELTFQPMLFQGRINRKNSQSMFDRFLNNGEIKNMRSKSISINVQAKPANIKQSDWLPAQSVSLSEVWSEDVSSLKNGEPVTRTITISAYGLMAENLPDLPPAEIKQLKQYPDKAALDNRVAEQGVSGVKQIKVALIPNRSGTFKLPAISIPWWNTKTGKQEVARLPEKIIQVYGEAANTATAPVQITPQAEQIQSDKTPADSSTTAGFWPWLSLALGLGWLITLIALLRKKSAIVSKKVKQEKVSLRPLENTVLKHCSNNETSQSKDALVSWAKARWPEQAINSLADIEKNVSTELAAEINALNGELYASANSNWQGSALALAFKAFRQQKVAHAKNEAQPLEPLYKA